MEEPLAVAGELVFQGLNLFRNIVNSNSNSSSSIIVTSRYSITRWLERVASTMSHRCQELTSSKKATATITMMIFIAITELIMTWQQTTYT